MLNYFSHHSNFFLFVIGTSGFLIGMLLNKIVHRLPSYLQTRWQSECREFLNSTPILITHSTKKNLLLQIICTLLSIIVVIHFGLHEKTIAALIFTWCLLALSFIDIEHYLLPDNLVLPLLWLGLLLSLFPLFVSSADAILGATLGYLSLYSLNAAFFRITGKTGMGEGDFKLCAAMGAWLGWKLLPFIILISAVLGAVLGSLWLIMKKQSKDTPLPFGPYLAFAGWIMMLYFS